MSEKDELGTEYTYATFKAGEGWEVIEQKSVSQQIIEDLQAELTAARTEIERLKETIVSNKGDIGKNSCQELAEARAEIERLKEIYENYRVGSEEAYQTIVDLKNELAEKLKNMESNHHHSLKMFTLEREITAMMRGALKECRLSAENHTGLNSKSVIMRVYDTSREALAREQEMRK